MHITTLITEALEDVRRPEYTGANRCLPCTVVNLGIASVLAGAVARFGSPAGGLTTLVVAVSLVYLRGYLVPGTPGLTKRYLPDVVLRAFGKRPIRGSSSVSSLEVEAFDAERALWDRGLLVEGPDDVILEPAFERAWYRRMVTRDASVPRLDDLASLLDVTAERLDVEYHDGDACTAFVDGQWLGQWESGVAFNADVTADAELTTRDPDWTSVPMAYRSELLAALRLCLDRCPACDSAVTLQTDTVESCCSHVDVVAAVCSGCGVRMFEAEYDANVLGAR